MPLAPDKTTVVGFDRVKKKFPEIEEWRVEFIMLPHLQDDKTGIKGAQEIWHYEITFHPKDKKEKERLEKEVGDQPLTVVVLLDGTIVLPTQK